MLNFLTYCLPNLVDRVSLVVNHPYQIRDLDVVADAPCVIVQQDGECLLNYNTRTNQVLAGDTRGLFEEGEIEVLSSQKRAVLRNWDDTFESGLLVSIDDETAMVEYADGVIQSETADHFKNRIVGFC